MSADLAPARQAVREALTNRFWQTEREGDAMFDDMADAALDAMTDVVDTAVQAAVARWMEAINLDRVSGLIDENGRLRGELATLTGARDAVVDTLVAAVRYLAAVIIDRDGGAV